MFILFAFCVITLYIILYYYMKLYITTFKLIFINHIKYFYKLKLL